MDFAPGAGYRPAPPCRGSLLDRRSHPPDDVLGHKTLADAITPTRLAVGKHLPNRVNFNKYLQTNCADFIQVDAVRVAGISKFITMSLLCREFRIPVVPHVGGMGQIRQRLVLFNARRRQRFCRAFQPTSSQSHRSRFEDIHCMVSAEASS
jgi:hypothetical protein